MKRSPGGTPYFFSPVLWAGGIACWFFIVLHKRYEDRPESVERLLGHEDVHIRQQRGWRFPFWLAGYLLSRPFRLSQECEAYATNVCWYVRGGMSRYAALIHYVKVIRSPIYRLAGRFSVADVFEALNAEVEKL